MAITPYLIEVFGIDLWHAVEFSRYECALILGLTTVGRTHHCPLGQKEKPRPQSQSGQIAHNFRGQKADFDGFWLLGKATRPTETSDFVAKGNDNRSPEKGQIEEKALIYNEYLSRSLKLENFDGGQIALSLAQNEVSAMEEIFA